MIALVCAWLDRRAALRRRDRAARHAADAASRYLATATPFRHVSQLELEGAVAHWEACRDGVALAQRHRDSRRVRR